MKKLKTPDETKKRSVVKSITWRILSFTTSVIIIYLGTGNFTASMGIAIAGAATGMVTYYLHERGWNRIKWGKAKKSEEPESTSKGNEITDIPS